MEQALEAGSSEGAVMVVVKEEIVVKEVLMTMVEVKVAVELLATSRRKCWHRRRTC